MDKLSQKDKDRFLVSVLFAIVLHLGLFTGLHFILNIRLEAVPQHTGPLYLEIGTEFEQEFDVREITPEEEKQEKETAADRKQEDEQKSDTSTTIVRKDDREEKSPDTSEPEPEENIVKDDPEHSLPDYEEAENKEDTSTTNEERITTKTPQPTRVPDLTPTPYDPALEEDSLAQLDKMLEEGDSSPGDDPVDPDSETDAEKDTTITENTDSRSTESGGPLFEWEDNRDRTPIVTYYPDIPDWVSEQRLQLKVRVSFLLTPDGFLTSLRVKESSGYTAFDSLILNALKKWSFPSASGAGDVYGEITYFSGVKE